MRRRLMAVLIVFAAGIGAATSPEQKKSTPRQENTERTASMVGCVDEQKGRYILVDDRELKKIADLEPDGFPVQGFAKHVGHKVVVRGTNTGGDTPLFKVRTVETVSEICAPANNQQGRQ